MVVSATHDPTPRAGAESKPSAMLLLQPLGTPAAERPVGARLQIGIDVVHIGRHVGVVAEALHDRGALAAPIHDDVPEGIDRRQPVDQRRREARADAVWTMAVIAAGMVAAKPVVRPAIHLAVDDPVKPALRPLVRTG